MTGYVWTGANDVEWDLVEGPAFVQEGAEGFSLPDFQYYTRETPLLDGQRYIGHRARAREIFLPIRLQTPDNTWDWPSLQRSFWDGVRPGVTTTLAVTDDNGDVRTIQCRFERDDSPTGLDPSVLAQEVIALALVADDPWWRGEEVTHQFQTPETPLPFYATSGGVFNLMSANTIDNTTVTNDGDLPAWPVFRIDGPITSFRISQFTDTAEIEATITVDAGDWLILDTDPRVQTLTRYTSLGGVEDVTYALTSTLFFAVPAQTDKQYYVELNGAGSLTLSFVPLYYRAY